MNSDGAAESTWKRLREQMPVAERWAYFDHAAVAPLTAAAKQAIGEWAEDTASSGDAHWMRWSTQAEQARSSAARLMNAKPSEVALVHSTTEGIGLVAEGFPWQSGDNVVLPGGEFPSNVYPWLNLKSRGVETRIVPAEDGRIDLSRIAAACDDRTRIVAASWVGYASGWRIDLDDLAEMTHRRGALLMLDAIQGLGVFPLDVRKTPIDFLAADGHKWLLGPEGAGLFFLRQEHLDLLRPLGVGWHSVIHSGDFQNLDYSLKPAASRYEGGTSNMPGILGLGASLATLLEFDTREIERRVLEISDLCCERLQSVGAKVASHREGRHRSGIVSFELPGKDPVKIREACLREHVVLSCRGGRLRISPHAYNNVADIDRLVAAIAAAS